jgi:hypothetical protein
MGHDYIEPENLKPFLTVLGWVVGHAFDSDDWTAIKHGVQKTNADTGHWFDYQFGNRQFSLAQEPDSTHVYVRIELAPELEVKLRMAIDICQFFDLQGQGWYTARD